MDRLLRRAPNLCDHSQSLPFPVAKSPALRDMAAAAMTHAELLLHPLPVVALSIILMMLWAMAIRARPRNGRRRLPPGPAKLPLIGSLLSLGGGEPVHRTLASLGEKHGPLMLLWLGSKAIIVVADAEHARQLLRDQDKNFSHRPYTSVGKYLGFEFKGMSFATYNSHWTTMREIYAQTHLSRSRVAASTSIREGEMVRMVGSVLRAHEAGRAIELSSVLRDTVTATLLAIIFGRNSFGLEKLGELMSTMNSFVDLAGSLVLADVIPALRDYDLQGVFRKMKVVQQRVRDVVEKLLLEYRLSLQRGGGGGGGGGDHRLPDTAASCLAEALLTRFRNAQLTRDAIIIAIWENIIGGTEPESITLDWTMAELLRHPRLMRDAQAELDTVVGRERLVRESDIESLPFLQCILKEAFRLHPPAPLGVPHVNAEATSLGGYEIPADTTVLLNLWAMGRDRQRWDRPLEFDPYRFAEVGNRHLQPMGHHFDLLPFMAGRRQCPGIHLAMASSHLLLATLLQCFEWKPALEVGSCVDMREPNSTKGAFICRRQSANLCSVVPRLPMLASLI